MNHDYLTRNVVESQLVIRVSQQANSDWLELEYLYTTPGVGKPDRHVEHDAFYLSTGVFVRDFVGDHRRRGGIRMQLDDASGLLRDGYGDYTARSAILWEGRHTSERIDYHLRPDSWGYEIYVNTDGSTWEKTGDWELKRTARLP